MAGIKEGFKVMDTNNKGKIDMNELRAGLHKLGHHIPEADIQFLMEAVSAPFLVLIFHSTQVLLK